MKRWIIRLAAAIMFLTIYVTASLWPTDVLVVIVRRDQFVGGQLSLTNGSSADIAPGSSTTVVLLKVKSDTEIVLACNIDGKLHSQKDGYIEGGPTHYLVVNLKRCSLNIEGIPRDFLGGIS